MSRLPRTVHVLGLALAAASLWAGPVAAQAIAQAYGTDKPLQRGLIVRISEDDQTKVEPLTAKANEKMEGVVVAANDAPVTLSTADQTQQQVFVATTGRYYVLVSTQNGAIKGKDYVTISALAGIGMKAGSTKGLVVGKALEAFDGTSKVSGTTKLKDSAGQEKTIALGLIAVDIQINRNPGMEESKAGVIPGAAFLQSGATTLVGEPVDMGRIYIACLVIFLTVAVAGSILYAGVRSSVLAIGRNPLAKSSVMKNLVQVLVVSITILVLGVGAVYLILKL